MLGGLIARGAWPIACVCATGVEDSSAVVVPELGCGRVVVMVVNCRVVVMDVNCGGSLTGARFNELALLATIGISITDPGGPDVDVAFGSAAGDAATLENGVLSDKPEMIAAGASVVVEAFDFLS